MSVKKRLEALVDKLTRDIASALIVKYRVRLTPDTLQHFRNLFDDALGAAKRIGRLHPYDDDREDTDARLQDTQPGFKSRPPPPPKKL
jgi:hypothetical protein